MSKPVLTYFDMKARGEPIKLALHAAGVEFSFKPMPQENWPAFKEENTKNGTLLFSQLPLLQIDGMNLVQSMAILRYISRKYLTKEAPEEVLCMIDMMMDEWTDVQSTFVNVVYNKTMTMEAFTTEYCPKMLALLEAACAKNGKKFLVTDAITIADCNGFTVVDRLESVKPDILESFPHLKKWRETMKGEECVKAFMRE